MFFQHGVFIALVKYSRMSCLFPLRPISCHFLQEMLSNCKLNYLTNINNITEIFNSEKSAEFERRRHLPHNFPVLITNDSSVSFNVKDCFK